MTKDELVQAVEAAVASLAQAYRDDATEADLYEAALLTIAVNAVKGAGGDVIMTSDGHNAVNEMNFRRAPGNLWAGDFTYGRSTFAGKPHVLEIHLGVYVAGKSGVAHECDVAVLDSREADRSRAGGVHPRCRGLVAAVEAKHYQASPGIGVGRGFLGLASEMGGPKCALAFPARSSATLGALLARKQPECLDEMDASSPAWARLQALLEQRVRNWIA